MKVFWLENESLLLGCYIQCCDGSFTSVGYAKKAYVNGDWDVLFDRNTKPSRISARFCKLTIAEDGSRFDDLRLLLYVNKDAEDLRV